MTSDDTFDTLKYGHIPVQHLINDCKHIDFSNFEYDDILDCYRYHVPISLFWDGDGYSLDCYIYNPKAYSGNDYENDKVVVNFMFTCHINESNNGEYSDYPVRYFPHFPDFIDEEYVINTRDDFQTIMYLVWKEFVYKALGYYFSHRIDIINELDEIVLKENEFGLKSNQENYILMLDKINNFLINNIQNISNFSKVGDWHEVQ